MLHYCTELLDKGKDKDEDKDKDKKEEDKEKEAKKEDDTFQGFAVIGIALIAMGEDVGAEMALRQFNHLVRIQIHRIYTSSHARVIDALRYPHNSQMCPFSPRAHQCIQSTTRHPGHSF